MAGISAGLYTPRAMLRNLALGAIFFCAASAAQAREDVRFWHALTGTQAAEIDRLAARFNAAQKEYRVLPSYKGALEVTFARALAIRRTAAAPHIVQIHESLTDDLIAEQLVLPLWQVMDNAKPPFEAAPFPAQASAFSVTHSHLPTTPYTTATPHLYTSL